MTSQGHWGLLIQAEDTVEQAATAPLRQADRRLTFPMSQLASLMLRRRKVTLSSPAEMGHCKDARTSLYIHQEPYKDSVPWSPYARKMTDALSFDT